MNRKISLISEFEKAIDKANYLDQIGWLILSFFLIFLGTNLSLLLSFSYGQVNIPIYIKIIIILIFIIFGIMVWRLFEKTQIKKLEEHKLSEKVGHLLNMERYKSKREIKRSKLSIWIFRILMTTVLFVLFILVKEVLR